MTTKNNKATKKDSKVIKILKAARDFYVNNMIKCSDSVYTGGMGSDSMPRSFSKNSEKSFKGDEDFKELVRLASVRRLSKINLDVVDDKLSTNKKLARSQTIDIGRIDEEHESDLSGNLADVYPRSKSVAVTKKTVSNVKF
ncbi:hypothetical protein ACFE04_001109 [Oxalis oulophora]